MTIKYSINWTAILPRSEGFVVAVHDREDDSGDDDGSGSLSDVGWGDDGDGDGGCAALSVAVDILFTTEDDDVRNDDSDDNCIKTPRSHIDIIMGDTNDLNTSAATRQSIG